MTKPLQLIKDDMKDNKRIFFISFFTSCLFCFCLPVNQIYKNHDYMPYQPTPALFTGIVLFTVIAYAAYKFFVSRRVRGEAPRTTHPIKRLAIYAAAPAIACVISIIALYPGIFTVDSLSQLRQAAGEINYNDWHPLGHTFLFYTIPYGLTGQLLSVTVAHVLFYIFTWAYLFSSLESFGLRRGVMLAVQACLVIIPTNLFLSVTMWKDIPFTCAGAMLTINLIKLYRDKQLFHKIPFLIGTGLLLGLFTVVRHNGSVVGPVVAVLFLIFYRKNILKAVIPAGIALAMLLSVRVAGAAVDAVPNPDGMPFRWFTQIAGGILYDGGDVTEEEMQKLDLVIPRDDWVKYFNRYLNDPLINSSAVKVQYTLGDYKRELVEATLSMSLRNPLKALNAELYITEITWRILPKGPVNVVSYSNRLDDYGLQIKKDTFLFKIYHTGMEFVRTSPLTVIFTHQGIFFFLTVCMFFIAVLRRQGWRALLVFTPVLFNVMSLWISIPSQDYRYVYLTVLAFPALVAFTFAPPSGDEEKTEKIRT